MKSHDERIKKLLEKAKDLSENHTGLNESVNVNADVLTFASSWEKLYKA